MRQGPCTGSAEKQAKREPSTSRLCTWPAPSAAPGTRLTRWPAWAAAAATGHTTQAIGLLQQAHAIFQRTGAAEAPTVLVELHALTPPPPRESGAQHTTGMPTSTTNSSPESPTTASARGS
jgi:hypothetical protein